MAGLDPAATFADVLRRGCSMTEAEIEKLLADVGRVLAGVSEVEGQDRAVRAAKAAIAPLLANDSGSHGRWDCLSGLQCCGQTQTPEAPAR